MSRRKLFVGLGSPQGDDQVGWLVARELQARCMPDWDIRQAASPADLLDWIDDVDTLVLCDACRSDGAPGEVFQWRWPDVPARAIRSVSSHGLRLSEVLALAGQLGKLPARVEVIAVEVSSCEPGGALTAAVAAAVPRVAALLQDGCNHA